MSRLDPAVRWAKIEAKRQEKQTRLLERMGILHKGVYNPYAMRTLSRDCTGYVNISERQVKAWMVAATITIAIVGGVQLFAPDKLTDNNYNPSPNNHNNSNNNTNPMSNDIYVGIHESSLDKTLTVGGNASAKDGLSALEVSVDNTSYQVKNNVSGKTTEYNEKFNMTTKEPGNYKAKVKVTDVNGKTNEMEKEFTLPNLAPIVKSFSIKQVNNTTYNATVEVEDFDNLITGGLVALVEPGTRNVIEGNAYDVLGPLEKKSTMYFSFENLKPGKYEVIASFRDELNKLSNEKRISFEVTD